MAFRPAIIVLGSGFTIIPDVKIYGNETENAAREGYALLMNGGTAVDAAEKAVRALEAHDHFNAGRGSCLNTFDEVECDAMIMDGNEMKTGAVISARHFPHPVSIAKKIMENSLHCALSGEGALEFARSRQMFDEICDPDDLKDYDECPNQRRGIKNEKFEENSRMVFQPGTATLETQDKDNYDSVGAVAIDCNGHLACAVSAGGIPGKLKGRVSDASLIGCGGYANEYGAAVVTGHGESLMKMTLARQVVFNMEQGQAAQEASENALKRMKECLKEHNNGGVIAIDRYGDLGVSYNVKLIVYARINTDGEFDKQIIPNNQENVE